MAHNIFVVKKIVLLSKEQLIPYCKFRTSRSEGSGGQHVNKTESRVEVIFNLEDCPLFTEEQTELIRKKLSRHLNQEGELLFSSQESRSQVKNKQTAIQKLVEAINLALIVPKKRKPSKPSKAAVEKRLTEKKRQSERKSNRKFRGE